MNFRDAWFVGCASAQLRDQPFATEILDQRLVLFRSTDGKPAALVDRCCHRGFPLSKGRCEGGRVACGFHGWQYDASGQCVAVPSILDPKKPLSRAFRVPPFPCEEKDGYVWVWMGGETRAPVPSIDEFADGKWIQGSRVIACSFLRALEITYDGAHVYVAHASHPANIAAKKHGMTGESAELRLTPRGCILFSPATAQESEPVPPGVGTMEFSLPGRIRFVWPLPTGPTYMNFFVTPIGEDRCRMDYLVQNFMPNAPHLHFRDGPSDIVDEDQAILEAIQRAYREEGEAFEKSVEADIPPLTLRRIVKRALGGAWQGESADDMPRRRVFDSARPAAWS
jgi:phenylpropionate dioxygenase-like ring-hydroxylating dioxygenase large terminal subunit